MHIEKHESKGIFEDCGIKEPERRCTVFTVVFSPQEAALAAAELLACAANGGVEPRPRFEQDGIKDVWGERISIILSVRDIRRGN